MLEDYDVSGIEYHHNKKADAPSGTAKSISKILTDNIKRKTSVLNNANRAICSNELHFTSVRCGSIPGTHSVIFDSLSDTITLTHQARNRDGFALGAILAAEWINGKTGFYNTKDFINNVIKGNKK